MNCKQFARKMFWRRAAVYVSFVIFAFFTTVAAAASLGLDAQYVVGDPAAKDAVVLYRSSSSAKDMGSQYLNQRKLEVEPGRTDVTITFEDVPKLAEQFGAKEVYIADVARIKEIRTGSRADGSVEVYSMPEKFIEGNRAGDDLEDILNYTAKAGALPKDGAREAVLSETAATAYGIDPEHWEGSTITVNGAAYKVVGVSRKVNFLRVELGTDKIAFLSYEEGSDLGIYRYSADTYEAFCERQKAYYAGTATPDREIDTAVFTGTGRAEEFTDLITQKYPGTQVYSEALYDLVQPAATRQQVLYTVFMLFLPALLTAAFINAILTSSEKKCFKKLVDRTGEERMEIRRCFRRSYIGFWSICAVIGAGVICVAAGFGMRTHTILLLVLYVLAVTGLGIFEFMTDGRFSKAPKRA